MVGCRVAIFRPRRGLRFGLRLCKCVRVPQLPTMAKFQVELAGEWKDYTKTEDRILTRAFMAGYPTCQFSLRGT
eukprot:1131899-Amphidinium_carterae.1